MTLAPRTTTRIIKGVDNDEGKAIVELIHEAVEKLDEQSSTPSVIVNNQQDPITALKMKFVNGEITQEEYEMKKAILEG